MKTIGPNFSNRVVMILFLMSVSIHLTGQNTGIYKKLYSTIYLSNSGSTDFLKKKKIHKSSLRSLKNFYSDKSSRSRSKAYSLARNIYNYSDDTAIKEQVVLDHLQACASDKSLSLRYRLANHLIQFEKKDFNAESIALIKELAENDPNKKQYIVIAGYKKIDIILPDIAEYTEDEIVESWEMIQGMARIGNPTAVQIC